MARSTISCRLLPRASLQLRATELLEERPQHQRLVLQKEISLSRGHLLRPLVEKTPLHEEAQLCEDGEQRDQGLVHQEVLLPPSHLQPQEDVLPQELRQHGEPPLAEEVTDSEERSQIEDATVDEESDEGSQRQERQVRPGQHEEQRHQGHQLHEESSLIEEVTLSSVGALRSSTQAATHEHPAAQHTNGFIGSRCDRLLSQPSVSVIPLAIRWTTSL